ncbi:hypothetical protein [Paludibacterium paludis]|uniref:VacJ n=1 Tax=Paludibacterium paludis TaxID=1225769 RepID=A0A918P6D8_9NEIS|nr:hypothetical protein [Paludibacterium paludis]GGY25014.1 hypothetical protein GCM10011289_30840 [Paludibacterium paludis]
MYFVDRSVAVIKPRAPFLEWLNAVPGNDTDLSLDSLRSDCTVILMPEFTDPEEGVSYIDDIYDQLFRMELASWYEDEALWPAERSLKTFWEWFDVEIHSTLIDSVEGDLRNYPAGEV